MPRPELFLLLIVAGFVLLLALIARFGGWRELARRYPADTALRQERWAWWEGRRGWWGLTSIRLRWFAGYNGCILWRADDEVLHLRIVPPFNLFHPPLAIPWSEMEVEKVTRLYIRVRLGDVPLYLSRRIARPLLAADHGNP
jgi:hypothetical protein